MEDVEYDPPPPSNVSRFELKTASLDEQIDALLKFSLPVTGDDPVAEKDPLLGMYFFARLKADPRKPNDLPTAMAGRVVRVLKSDSYLVSTVQVSGNNPGSRWFDVFWIREFSRLKFFEDFDALREMVRRHLSTKK